ncbi:MAG: glycosyltransferase family 2 protein [Planctomycetes bacterium]|nr:glycosyltransferase family 2 protein [Planctomycetota bacterium]
MIRDLTIVLPAYNEALRIGATIDKVLAYAQGRFDRLELIVVDDGSTDGTGDLVERTYGSRVRVLRRPNGGKGAAVRTGVQAATRPWILFADADLAIPIREIEKLAAHVESAPIVIGSKRAPGNDIVYPKFRLFLGAVGGLLISLLVVPGFHDTQCGFKLYRTDVAQELFAVNRLDGFGFDFEVLYLARRYGHRVIEVPVRVEHQLGSTVRATSYLRVLREAFSVFWNKLTGAYPPRGEVLGRRAPGGIQGPPAGSL